MLTSFEREALINELTDDEIAELSRFAGALLHQQSGVALDHFQITVRQLREYLLQSSPRQVPLRRVWFDQPDEISNVRVRCYRQAREKVE